MAATPGLGHLGFLSCASTIFLPRRGLRDNTAAFFRLAATLPLTRPGSWAPRLVPLHAVGTRNVCRLDVLLPASAISPPTPPPTLLPPHLPFHHHPATCLTMHYHAQPPATTTWPHHTLLLAYAVAAAILWRSPCHICATFGCSIPAQHFACRGMVPLPRWHFPPGSRVTRHTAFTTYPMPPPWPHTTPAIWRLKVVAVIYHYGSDAALPHLPAIYPLPAACHAPHTCLDMHCSLPLPQPLPLLDVIVW